MRTIAVANAQTSERVRTIAAPQILLVWTLPILYPLSLSVIFRSVELTQANVALGSGLLALAIAWSMAGPVVGWLSLNYLDHNGLDRTRNRLVVNGAWLATVTPARTVLVALAAFLPASDSVSPASATNFRHIHATSAIVLATYALAHVFNHSLAIISIGMHTAVLHLFRLAYRQNVGQTILIGAVAMQVCTGLMMVWKYHLRRSTPLRNLQLVSGVYLAIFLVTHLITVFTTRHSGIDTDFVWASHAPAGLLAGLSTVPLLPRYSLAVLAVFIHLACQARWNLSRAISDSAARKASYSLMAVGGITTAVISLAACGIHWMK
ncbi:MAG: hypothetical protein DMG49_15745 [Acidobacteria bacterium]|nr:MAG: hypothetical protein DMG49_15745 [Acidobacteriota bacterium]